MRSHRLRKIAHADFALPRRKRIRVQVGEGDGPAGVDAHLRGFTLRRTPEARKFEGAATIARILCAADLRLATCHSHCGRWDLRPRRGREPGRCRISWC